MLEKWALRGPDPLCSSLDWSRCKSVHPPLLRSCCWHKAATVFRNLSSFPNSSLIKLSNLPLITPLTWFTSHVLPTYPLLETQKPGWSSLFINVFFSKSVFPPTLSLQVPLSFPPEPLSADEIHLPSLRETTVSVDPGAVLFPLVQLLKCKENNLKRMILTRAHGGPGSHCQEAFGTWAFNSREWAGPQVVAIVAAFGTWAFNSREWAGPQVVAILAATALQEVSWAPGVSITDEMAASDVCQPDCLLLSPGTWGRPVGGEGADKQVRLSVDMEKPHSFWEKLLLDAYLTRHKWNLLFIFLFLKFNIYILLLLVYLWKYS